MTIRQDRKYRREDVQHRHDTFRRTGHFPDCARVGCDDAGCAAARLVSRWDEGRR